MDKRIKKLELKNINFKYSVTEKTILNRFCLDVAEHELLCILGPSGCGKSTILNIISGFLQPQGGKVLIDNTEVVGPTTKVGYVFQHHGLFPWKTVADNIGLGIKDPINRPNHIRHFAEQVGLIDFLDFYPSQLSVGMKQRVNLARAFAQDKDIVLLDEPFASLDMLTSYRMQELLNKIRRDNPKTMVFVTHNIDEALILANRIIVLTSSPSSIRHEIALDLPEARTIANINETSYIKLKQELISILFSEDGANDK